MLARADHRPGLEDLADLGPPVQAFFARRVANPADVEDLTQTALMRLVTRVQDRERDAIANPKGYIFQIAATLLKERHRTAAARIAISSAPLDPESARLGEESSPERILLGKEALAGLIQVLQELPERTRMFFILNRLEGLTIREIASRAGCSASLVEKELMRATAHLRDRASTL